MCKYVFMERIELHEIYMLLRLFPQVLTENLLHTRTCATGQTLPRPTPGPGPSLFASGAKRRSAQLAS